MIQVECNGPFIAYITQGRSTEVYLENKFVGTIKQVEHGYAYYPKGAKTPGEILPTIEEIKATLEEF